MNKNYIAPFILFALDTLWLQIFMKHKYNDMITEIQKEKMEVKLLPAMLAYIIMIIGLIMFVIPNVKEENNLMDSLKYGFMFGFISYGIYNFTNLSIVKKWHTSTAIIDTLWGGILYFLTAYLTNSFTKTTNSTSSFTF